MLEIEIVEVNTIEEGVEVFARFFEDGSQVGFGDDGTIDIERFRFVNPPVLVDDPNGDIVETTNIEDIITGEITTRTRTFREDPEEATLQALEQTFSVMTKKSDSTNIIPGKRGNTTTTSYASFDAFIYDLNGSASSWNTVHDATAGTTNDGSNLQARAGYGSGRICTRSFITFDTSAVGTDTISSATFSVYGQAVSDADTTSTILTSASPASDSAVETGDYDNFDYLTSTANQTYGSQALSAFSTSAYNDFSLTADGIAYINGSGNTVFGMVNSRDFDDSDPSGDNYAQTESTAYAGTTRDPKLVVEHTAGGGGGSTFTPRVMFF